MWEAACIAGWKNHRIQSHTVVSSKSGFEIYKLCDLGQVTDLSGVSIGGGESLLSRAYGMHDIYTSA